MMEPFIVLNYRYYVYAFKNHSLLRRFRCSGYRSSPCLLLSSRAWLSIVLLLTCDVSPHKLPASSLLPLPFAFVNLHSSLLGVLPACCLTFLDLLILFELRYQLQRVFFVFFLSSFPIETILKFLDLLLATGWITISKPLSIALQPNYLLRRSDKLNRNLTVYMFERVLNIIAVGLSKSPQPVEIFSRSYTNSWAVMVGLGSHFKARFAYLTTQCLATFIDQNADNTSVLSKKIFYFGYSSSLKTCLLCTFTGLVNG